MLNEDITNWHNNVYPHIARDIILCVSSRHSLCCRAGLPEPSRDQHATCASALLFGPTTASVVVGPLSYTGTVLYVRRTVRHLPGITRRVRYVDKRCLPVVAATLLAIVFQ